MKKHFTRFLGIAVLLFVGVWNVNGQTETVIFHETFNNLTTENTTGGALSGGNTDETGYNVGGGGTGMKCSIDGTMDLTGGRFETKKLDLTGEVKLYVTYKLATETTKRFQIDIDKSGTSGMGGILNESGDSPNEFTTKEFAITIGTAESYIHFRTESDHTIILDEIKITKMAASGTPTITSFEIEGVTAVVDQDAGTITAELPYGTDLTALTPTVTIGGSATGYTPTGAQNFTSPVDYTVSDGTNEKTYTVTLTTQTVAFKELTELIFSNTFNAFIKDETVTAYYMEGTEKPTIQSFEASDGATVALSEDGTKVLVTGADNVVRELALTLEPVAPFTEETPLIFDGSETDWIKTGYTFATDGKGWRFAKAVEEESNKRISEGKTRLYFFVGEYDKLTFTSGSGGNRAIKVFVNGVEQTSPTATGAAGTTFDIILSGAEAYMVEIESNQTSGDGGVVELVTTPNVLTSAKQTPSQDISFDGSTIHNPNNIKLNVFDIAGRLMISSDKNIEMGSKQKGIYIVKSGLNAMKINVR